VKNRRILVITLGIVSVFVMGIVVAYSALSTTLNAKFNTVTSQALNWNIGFEKKTGYYVTNAYSDYYRSYIRSGYWASGFSSNPSTCGGVLVEDTGVYLNDVELSKTGEKCGYILSIKNSGGINATLSSISATRPTLISGSGSCSTSGAKMTCGNITYKMTTDSAGNTLLSSNTSITAGSSKDVYLIVEYTGSSKTEATWSGGGFNFNYSQA